MARGIEIWPSLAEFFVYDQTIYRLLAGDTIRNKAYRNACNKVLKGKTVVEIGPGTELVLSRLCLDAGAQKVYAIEILEETCRRAQERIAALDLEDRIVLIHGDATRVDLPEKVDYCVSEIIGPIGGVEGAARIISSCRRFLRNPANMIPRRTLTRIAAVYLPPQVVQAGLSEIGMHYVRKTFEHVGYPFDLRVCLKNIPKANLVSTSDTFEDHDYTRPIQLEERHDIRLEVTRDGAFSGFLVWLELFVDREEVIDVLDHQESWLPVYFPLFRSDISVQAGDRFEGTVTRTLSSNGLNPDYLIKGNLYRRDLAPLCVVYEAPHFEKRFKSNSFYRNLLAEYENPTSVSGPPIPKNGVRLHWPEISIPRLFEKQVARSPDQVALIHGGAVGPRHHWTWRAVNQKANRLAHRLQSLGVGPEVPVGILLERSPETVVALLAVWKAGGASVPLDPRFPPQHIRFVLAETRARVVLTKVPFAATLPDNDSQILFMEEASAPPFSGADRTPETSANLDNLALILYTSGSTGQPKGVAMAQRQLLNRFHWLWESYPFQESECVGQRTSVSFIPSLWEMLGALLKGTPTVILPDEVVRDPATLIQVLAEEKVTRIAVVPFLLKVLMDFVPDLPCRLPHLKLWFTAGEVLTPELYERFRRAYPGAVLHNDYGSTEVGGVLAFDSRWTDQAFRRVPVGRPIANCKAYILDDNLNPVDAGAVGELYIGGIPVSRGYINHPSLTAEKFIPDPFSGEPGARLFNMGDLAAWRPDGMIELLGRRDHQVKIRGIRVELGGVESVLAQHPEVRENAVTVDRKTSGDRELVAIVAPRLPGSISPERLRDFLREKLPEVMVPSRFMLVDALPRTPNGKIDRNNLTVSDAVTPPPMQLDRRSLAVPATPPPSRTSDDASSAELEQQLAAIFSEVLGIECVGVHDNFFDLGGNSIVAIQLVSKIRKHLQVEIPVTLVFESPVLWSMANRIEELLRDSHHVTNATIVPAGRADVVPLSYEQERLWFVHEHMEDQRTSYNITASLHFEGRGFSIAALRAAFNALVARHETLRTCFFLPEGAAAPMQRIVEPWVMEVPLRSATARNVPEVAKELSRHIFDLRNVPLLKACVLRLADDEHVVMINIHHIVSDGWSFSVLLGELQQFYDAHVQGRDPELPSLWVQYADYVLWQRRQELEPNLEYWKGALSSYEDGLDLPYDRPRAADRAWRAATLRVGYPEALSKKLDRFSRSRRCSLFMSLLAGFVVVMNRYTQREDLCIGTTVAGRDDVELEKLVGFFINILALRLDVSGDPSFEEVLRRTREVVLRGFEHRALPFEHVLNALRVQRDSSLVPLVPVVLRHQNFPYARVESWSEGVTLKRFELSGDRTTASEMDWQFYGDGSSLELELEYAGDLFLESTVRRMVEHHQRALEALVDDPGRRLSDFSVLTVQEQELYAAVNSTDFASIGCVSIVERFEQQVEATPDEVACIGVLAEDRGGEQSLSYRELNGRANQVARRLRALGIGAESRVAVFCDRSPELLVGLLGIFKAGACYVPVDPEYPKRYVEKILDDANPTVVLSRRALIVRLPEGWRVDGWLDLDAERRLADASIASLSEANESNREPVHALQLASVAYTSGSTGEPKGVMVPYGQVQNWLQASWSRSPYGTGERTMQKTPSTFVVSLKELLSGLLAGVPQVIVPDLVVKDSVALVEVVDRWKITRMNLVPSHLRALLDSVSEDGSALRSLRTIVTAGEALPQSLRARLGELLPEAELWNNYGCTELNDVTYARAGADGTTHSVFVPIGKPIDNVRVFVLDEQLRQVPVGVMGELHVDSPNMARGYWRQPELTAERFIANPYGVGPGSRLYKTGDMVRYLASGSLEYLGRRDFEIKVRGHRIDVRQVEKVLHASDDILQAVVSGWNGSQLVAYLVSREQVDLDVQAIRRYVSEHLPTYMVPTLYMQLPTLPTLPSGKIDRRSLPAPASPPPSRTSDDASRGELEQQLAAIFSEVLGIEHIAIHDNFFDLGGHSLLASQVVLRIEHELDVRIQIADLFRWPTIDQLGAVIRQQENVNHTLPPSSSHKADAAVLSFAQERMFFLHRFVKGVPYNTPGLLLLKGKLDTVALERTLRSVVERHSPLRTIFVENDGAIMQLVRNQYAFDLPLVSVADEAALDAALRVEMLKPLDLEHDLMIRAILYRLDEEHHYLFLVIHHIAFDGWSSSILFRDMGDNYVACLRSEPSPLRALQTTYSDYAVWERKQLVGDALQSGLDYWRSQLAGVEPLLLPTTYTVPPVQSFAGDVVAFEIDEPTTGRLKRLSADSGSTMYMVLLGALAVLLSRYTGREDICIGSPVANRRRIEFQDLIGLFVNTLVMRIDLRGDPPFTELLRRIRTTALAAYDHQDIPFEKLIEELDVPRDTARPPLAQVVFNFQNTPVAELQLPDLTVTRVPIHNATSKFEITVDISPTGASLSGSLEFASDLFSVSFIESMIRHLQVLIRNIVADPGVHISQLPILPSAEMHALIRGGTGPDAGPDAIPCIHDIFDKRRNENSQQTAVLYGNSSITYGELGTMVDRIAGHLQAARAGQRALVGLCLERSLDLVSGALGILKAGCAYVPIDPDASAEVIYGILYDANLDLLITQSHLLPRLPITDQQVVLIDMDIIVRSGTKVPSGGHITASAGELKADPSGPAYVNFTSDEADPVKGVIVNHAAAVSGLDHVRKRFLGGEPFRFLLQGPITCERCVQELWQWIVCGGSLSILDSGAERETSRLIAQIERDSIHVIHVAPSALLGLLGHLNRNQGDICRLSSLRFIFCGADALPIQIAERFEALVRSRGIELRLVSAYGKRETAIGAAYFDHTSGSNGQGMSAGAGSRASGQILLGEPATGMSFYVLQKNGDLAPAGIPGDLYVGGRQLASGYFQDPDATEMNFIANPFQCGTGGCAPRLLMTGDVARWLSNGHLEFVSRADVGAGTRDRRIDLHRIEAELRRLKNVRDVVVAYREDDGGEDRLIAYVVREETCQAETPAVRATISASMDADLRRGLPEYMLPWSYVFLESLPLTAHGSVDRKALPMPESDEDLARSDHVAPIREIDLQLARIWQDVLRRSVGVHDNFFDLGGNSIVAIQLVSKIRKHLQVEIPVTLVFESPVLWSMANRIEELLRDSHHVTNATIVPAGRADVVPLSYEQERLWFVHEHMEDQRTSYNITASLHFEGRGFSIAALRAAFNALVARHETLRTCFFLPEGAAAPMQRIVEPWVMEVPLRSATARNVPEVAKELSRHIFDLRNVPLLKACVLRLADDEHVVMINIHHIVSDGWSFSVLLGELQQFYDAHVQGRDPELPSLWVQYADYVLWQRRQELEPNLEYWKGALSSYEDGLDLPYDRPRAADRAWRAATLRVGYPEALSKKLDRFSRSRRCSLFMSLLAGFVVVMNRYTQREDLCIGTTVAGRDDVELEKLVGFFINILALRLDVSGDPSFEEVLRRTREVVLRGFEHRALPFEHVLNALRVQRDSSLVPLVPVVLRHQNFPYARVESWSEGVTLKRFELSGDRTTASEMDWQFYGDGSSLELELEYAGDLFLESTVRRMVEHHQRALEALVDDPGRRLSDFSVLTVQEQELYAAVNSTDFASIGCVSIVERFEQQVEATPDEVACIGVLAEDRGGEQSLSYRELNGRANQVARRLRALGIGAESRVAVFCDRSPELLVGLLGIFKAGACYVPVDPEYPKRYVEKILDDANPTVVLSRRALIVRLPEGWRVDGWLDLDAERRLADASIASLSEANESNREPVHALQLASVAYTSGSTGEPKGVMVPYGQVQNWLQASWSRSPYGTGERTMQKTPSTFVVSLKELLSGLLAGVPQVIVPDLVVKDSVALVEVVDRWKITRMNLVPSHLRALLDSVSEDGSALRSLRTIVTAGEALPQSLRARLGELLPEAELWNNYGCTELNDVTYARAGADGTTHSVFVPIGKPIDNVRVFVLDEQLRQVPVGVMGELHVDSPNMARGYWRQPELTAERFIANPYGVGPGSRLYKTGDMVRYLASGSLEYLGRRDFEIKVRGHRIDVRQVEKVLHASDDILQAVVSGWNGSQLVAYLVSREQVDLDVQAIRRYVSEHLPTYMVPTLYMQLPTLPTLPSGKIDRRSLPAPASPPPSRTSDDASRGELEQQLAAIFSEVLGIEHIAIHDNFFDLGGHSLLASQLMSRVRNIFKIDLPIATVFEHSTVTQLAQCIALQLKDGARVVVSSLGRRLSVDRVAPLSYEQERLWFIHHYMKEQRTSYNGTAGLRIRGPLHVDALREAFRALVARHEILRTTFPIPVGSAAPVQVIHDLIEPDILIAEASEGDTTSYMDQLSTHVYDLANGPLLIARILKLGENYHALLIGMHHIIYDGWSQLSIMARDIDALYAEKVTGLIARLPELPVQYADFAIWQRNQSLDGHVDYWKAKLQGYHDDLELPNDYPRPSTRNWHAASITVTYGDELAHEFARFNRAHGATLFMGLVASFAIVLSRFTGRDDICIGTTVGGRSQVELENLIGFFVNVVPLRLDLSGDPDVTQMMARAKSTVLAAFEHQALPFERILSALQKHRDSSRIPLVPVIVRHQNFPTTMVDKWHDGLTIEVIERDERTTPNELDLQFFGDGGYLKAVVEYAAELYSEATIRRIMRYHRHVIEIMIGGMEESGQHHQ